MNLQQLKMGLSKFKEQNLLVMGDLMIDEYLWGNIERISPEAPVQVVDIEREESTLGGAGNVIKNLIGLGAKVHVGSIIDDKENGNFILNELNRFGISTGGLFREPDKTSSKKTRILSSSNNQQLLRVDKETISPISKDSETKIINFVNTSIKKFDAIIISDYMKGFLTEDILSQVIKIANIANKPTIIDPKGKNYQKYRNSTIITPNKKEAELASGIEIINENDLKEVGKKLLGNLKTDAVLVTLGKDGMVLFEKGKNVINIPTTAKEIYDITGAGDTVVSVLGLGIASGLTFKESAKIANIAASIVVGKVGTATATIQEILEQSEEHRIHFNNKLKERKSLKSLVDQEKLKGKTIVFTNGCFDILHTGHVKHLQEAKSLGDILILGLNSDGSVRRLKGNRRPIMAEEERARILSALGCIDYITLFRENTPIRLIKSLKPDILVKGKDYKKEEVVGWNAVEEYGGKVVLLDLVEGVSTSTLIDDIIKKNNKD